MAINNLTISELKRAFSQDTFVSSQPAFDNNIQKTVKIINSFKHKGLAEQVDNVSTSVFQRISNVFTSSALKDKTEELRQKINPIDDLARNSTEILDQISKDLYRMDLVIDGRSFSKEAKETYLYLRDKLFEKLFAKTPENDVQKLMENLDQAIEEITKEAKKEDAPHVLKHVINLLQNTNTFLDEQSLLLEGKTDASFSDIKHELDELTNPSGKIRKEITDYQINQMYQQVLNAFKGDMLEAIKFCNFLHQGALTFSQESIYRQLEYHRLESRTSISDTDINSSGRIPYKIIVNLKDKTVKIDKTYYLFDSENLDIGSIAKMLTATTYLFQQKIAYLRMFLEKV